MALPQLIKLNSHPEGTIRAEKLLKVAFSIVLILVGCGATCGVDTWSEYAEFLACAVPLAQQGSRHVACE